MHNTNFLPQNIDVLHFEHIKLEPLTLAHTQGLAEATKDGEIWQLIVTSAPHYDAVHEYIELALNQQQAGFRQAFAVIDMAQNKVIGTTSYYDFASDTKRLEIGYTWYAKSAQRTNVNTICKFLLLCYAFENLGANTVALRTDILNTISQKAIERLGAKKDGVLRGHMLRKDGSLRDTVMYSMIQSEWGAIKSHLLYLLEMKYKA